MSNSSPYAAPEREAAVAVRAAPVALANPWIVLGLLAASHFLVDIVAGTTSPLWPVLELNLAIETGGLLWVYVVWSIATSFTQLLVGIWADRYPSRWVIWVGPLLAILCLSCLGLASSPITLVALFVIGGIGIAAFHPEAAATAGALLPAQRSRAMAIFALSGYLGQSAGPTYSGLVTDHFGVRGLTWGIAWGLPILLALYLALRRAPAPVIEPKQAAAKTAGSTSGFGVLPLLLAVGALRILPALGVPLALSYILKATDAPNAVIGAVQSAFMAGIGIGAMGCAAFLQRKWERTALWLFPLCASPILAILGASTGWTLVLLVATCGLFLGVTMPVYISYGQQLLPHGQRVASSITMGVSWGVGAGIVATAISAFNRIDWLPGIFGFYAVCSLSSSVLCYFLPTPNRWEDTAPE